MSNKKVKTTSFEGYIEDISEETFLVVGNEDSSQCIRLYNDLLPDDAEEGTYVTVERAQQVKISGPSNFVWTEKEIERAKKEAKELKDKLFGEQDD